MNSNLVRQKFLCFVLFALISEMLAGQNAGSAQNMQWKIHDMSRPKSPVVQSVDQLLPAPVPQNAISLFDGSGFSNWVGSDNGNPKWKIEKDYMEIVPGTGAIQTKESFGDVFLHIEWASPDEPDRKGQDRGNSGIFFMGMYELQVLDSYQADTYADGQAGALYGQAPPRFNVCKPRGQWNAYDISFRRPRFSSDGKLLTKARITVIHNGILIQDNEEYWGPTSWLKFLPYKAHRDKLPISLQEHNGRVRFRNIWAVSLPELPGPDKSYGSKTIHLDQKEIEKFTGTYNRPGTHAPIMITMKNGKLFGDFFYRPGPLELLPFNDHQFVLKETDGIVTFEIDKKGKVAGLVFHIGDDDMPAKKD